MSRNTGFKTGLLIKDWRLDGSQSDLQRPDWEQATNYMGPVSLALWDRDMFVSGQGGLRPGVNSGSGSSVAWGPCHLKSLGNIAAQVTSQPFSKRATQVPRSIHCRWRSNTLSPLSFPLLQHQLLLRLLKIDAGFFLQSRKPVWLLGQHLAFISATEGAVWLWVHYELVRRNSKQALGP